MGDNNQTFLFESDTSVHKFSQPCLIFVRKARVYPLSAPLGKAPVLLSPQKNASDKQSSLVCVNDERKKVFYNCCKIVPQQGSC